MLTPTYELKRLDIIQHLNGEHYIVDAVDWVNGDNYVVTCINNNDDLISFYVDVHIAFNVVMTYGTKVGN